MRLGLGISIPGTSGLVQAAGFSPLDLSPVLWLDASDTSTITEVGGAVSQWDDLSGNGNDFVQATAAQQPSSGTRTLNSLNVLDFNSSSEIRNATITWGSTAVVFIVGEDDAISGTARLHIQGLTGSIPQIGIVGGTNFRLSQGTVLDQGTASTGVKLWRAIFGATDTLHIDGVLQVTGNAGTGTPTGISIGGTFYRIFGAIAEVIIVDGTLTAGQISDTEQYLADKWGITL